MNDISNLCILFIGQMRTYNNDIIINSYNKYLSNYGNIDIYIHTWDNRGSSNRHGKNDSNIKEVDTITENIISEHYNKFKFFTIKKIVIDRFEHFYNTLDDELVRIYNTSFLTHSTKTTSVPIQYKYQRAANILTRVNNNYSRVIVLRPDFAFYDYLPISLNDDTNTIYFQHIAQDSGCMDHCWFSSQQTIIKQLINIFDNYKSNIKSIQNRCNNKLLFYQCLINNINIKVYRKNLVKQIFYNDI